MILRVKNFGPIIVSVSTQVFTGAIPFGDRSPSMAMIAILRGDRPLRPTHPTCTAELWTLMGRCWNQDPRLRPKASEVWKVLLGV